MSGKGRGDGGREGMENRGGVRAIHRLLQRHVRNCMRLSQVLQRLSSRW